MRSRLDRSSRVWLLLGEFAEVRGLEERVVSALHDVATSGRVRRTRYERAEGLGLRRAQRDLRDLAAAGVLTPVGRTRARFCTAGPAFPEPALEAARTPLPLADPYTR